MNKEEETEDAASAVKASPTRAAAKRPLSRFQLKCSNCDFRVSTPALLENHARVKHLDQEWFRCKLCNFFTATSSWMEVHLSSDSHTEREKGEKIAKSASFNFYVEHINRESIGEDAIIDDIEKLTGKEEVATSSEGDPEAEETVETSKAAEAEEEDLDLEPPAKKRGRPKHGSTTTCGYCGLVVSNATNLSVHVRRKHSKEYGYSCTLCNYSCVTKGDMDRHCFTKKHSRRAQECASKNPVNNQTSPSPQEAAIVQVHEPNAASQEADKEDEPDASASKDDQTQPDTSQNVSKYDSMNACGHCDFVAQSFPSLHLHIKRKHTKDFEYVCLACSYYAVTSREMSRHANTEKHKQKSQKYLELLGNDWQRPLALPPKPKEVSEPVSPAEEAESCSEDSQAAGSQDPPAAEPVEAAVSAAGSSEEKPAESLPSPAPGDPDPAPQMKEPAPEQPPAPAEPQPAADQSAQPESQEEEANKPDDVTTEDGKTPSPQSDTQMYKAPPFDACIMSMKALAEQEQALQDGQALEGEAAAICLTGGVSLPPSFQPYHPAYVKKFKRKEGRTRDEAKGSASRIRCDDCGFMADGVSGLNVHISMKHPSKEKHFHCLVCGKSFYTESNLHQHLTSAAHLRNEQNSVEELPEGGASFKCVKCTDRFETEQDLFIHIKEKHEELLREVNKYVLEDTEQINREREENQGSVCKYCGKVCKSSNSMAFLAHIRTHTGKNPASGAQRFLFLSPTLCFCLQGWILYNLYTHMHQCNAYKQ